MNKENLYIWACDYSNETGEGNLARLFVRKLRLKYKTKVTSANRTINSKILNYKYISPIIGVLFCWKNFFLNRNNCYLNYLPMWNFIVFLFLPPNTILGPITGGAKFNNYKNLNIIRKFLFPVFYKITELILLTKNCEIFFSTDLLKENLSLRLKKKSNFNFILNGINKYKLKKKKIDFLIYFRKHKNKETHFPYSFIRKLIIQKFEVIIVGDKLNIIGIKNYGYVSNKELNKLLSQTKYSIGSGESILTMFVIDCINNDVIIVLDKNYNHKINFYKESFVEIDFKKNENLRKKLNL